MRMNGNSNSTRSSTSTSTAATAMLEQAPTTNAIVLRRIVNRNGCDLIKSSCAYFLLISGIGAKYPHKWITDRNFHYKFLKHQANVKRVHLLPKYWFTSRPNFFFALYLCFFFISKKHLILFSWNTQGLFTLFWIMGQWNLHSLKNKYAQKLNEKIKRNECHEHKASFFSFIENFMSKLIFVPCTRNKHISTNIYTNIYNFDLPYWGHFT